MPRRVKKQGRLFQKPKVKIAAADTPSQQATSKSFRILAMQDNFDKVWVEGEFTTLEDAKEFINTQPESTIAYYVHSDSSRVVYSKGGA